MSIFDQQPRWMAPGEFMLAAQQSAESIGRNFTSGMAIGQRAAEAKSERELKQQQMDAANSSLGSFISEFNKYIGTPKDKPVWDQPPKDTENWGSVGASPAPTTPTVGSNLPDVPGFLAKNPQWLTNPYTADAAKRLMDVHKEAFNRQMEVDKERRAVQAASIDAKNEAFWLEDINKNFLPEYSGAAMDALRKKDWGVLGKLKEMNQQMREMVKAQEAARMAQTMKAVGGPDSSVQVGVGSGGTVYGSTSTGKPTQSSSGEMTQNQLFTQAQRMVENSKGPDLVPTMTIEEAMEKVRKMSGASAKPAGAAEPTGDEFWQNFLNWNK